MLPPFTRFVVRVVRLNVTYPVVIGQDQRGIGERIADRKGGASTQMINKQTSGSIGRIGSISGAIAFSQRRSGSRSCPPRAACLNMRALPRT
jgi:hypothetical protein